MGKGTGKKNSSYEKRISSLKRLLSLGDEKLLDEEFQAEAKKHREDIIIWWKRKYGYSSNDQRFLTVTITQVYEDFLEEIMARYNKEIGGDSQSYRIHKGRFLNKNFDKQESTDFKKQMLSILSE